MIKTGIIGCGTIGAIIASAVTRRFSGAIKLAGVCDKDKQKAHAVLSGLGVDAGVLNIEELIRKSDLIIEAASPDIAYEIARKSLEAGKDVMVMSTGGLLGRPDIFELAKKIGAKIYLPSGALCGLDGIKSAMMANVKSITLTSRKPPAGLAGAPYVIKNNIDLNGIKKETIIFEGTAEEAVKGFPKNVNVSATLSMCALGGKNTKVRIVTSPGYTSNSHEVEANGDFGKLKTITENMPMPGNPRTSYMAALSAVATLKNIVENSSIGN